MNTYRVDIGRARVERRYDSIIENVCTYEVDAASRDEAGQQAKKLWLATHAVSVANYPISYSWAAVRSIDPIGKEG